MEVEGGKREGGARAQGHRQAMDDDHPECCSILRMSVKCYIRRMHREHREQSSMLTTALAWGQGDCDSSRALGAWPASGSDTMWSSEQWVQQSSSRGLSARALESSTLGGIWRAD